MTTGVASGNAATGTDAVSFPADINPRLAEAFMEEGPGHAAGFSECVQRIAAGSGSGEELARAQRHAHTLKGSAAITGVRPLATLMHHAEAVLEQLGAVGGTPDAELAECLVEAADCVEAMFDTLSAGGPAPAWEPMLERLDQWHRRLNDDETSTELAANVVVESEEAPTPRPQASGSVRVGLESIERMMQLAGEFGVAIVQSQGLERRASAHLAVLGDQERLVAERLLALHAAVERGSAVTPSRERASSGADDFDPLELDQYNELHSALNAFTEAATDARELTNALRVVLGNLRELFERETRMSRELDQTVLSARMVAVAGLVPRLARVVRQTCRARGKQAELQVEGAELEVDGEILRNLTDPLMHALRNAVDHGIETPAERQAAGKPEHGVIHLSFRREGESLVIRLGDDGAGFDVATIRERAQQRGLLQAGVTPSDDALVRLALRPGFSTRESADEVSGRGIGLDVLEREVRDMRGSLEVVSRRGAGATLLMRVPLTLISMHVLLVRAGENTYAVPSSALAQVLDSQAGELDVDGAKFTFDDVSYRVRPLGELLGFAGASLPHGRVTPVLLLRDDPDGVAITVDEAVDSRYLVVKRLGSYVPRVRGVVGGSILQDGSVAPVLDLLELMREPASTSISIAEQGRGEARPQARVLVVDDSLSARRALELVLESAGFAVRTAVDGLAAVDAIEEEVPDVVLLDLEMPRMNGLELASHLRADERTHDLPLVLITSRTTHKHHEQARAAGVDAILTKPWDDRALLELLEALLVDTEQA